MAKPSMPRDLRKKILLGVAVTAIPLAGCDLINVDGSSTGGTSAGITASPDEVAAFEAAKSQGTVASVEQFLRSYPDSALVRKLLQDQSTTTLRRINEGVVRNLSPAVVSSLSPRVKQALRLDIDSGAGNEGRSGASDGYSG
ncbi:hypothetical protein [uncultured Ruegeria sp.]|uniref:hypothetical protein n=1 Tax=uncultured Ruegeria sp. TaxID=259304 RepID=UPI002605EF90|nr:hypothetical protein [uncultured Ruegeria sp.]